MVICSNWWERAWSSLSYQQQHYCTEIREQQGSHVLPGLCKSHTNNNTHKTAYYLLQIKHCSSDTNQNTNTLEIALAPTSITTLRQPWHGSTALTNPQRLLWSGAQLNLLHNPPNKIPKVSGIPQKFLSKKGKRHETQRWTCSTGSLLIKLTKQITGTFGHIRNGLGGLRRPIKSLQYPATTLEKKRTKG